MDFDFKSRIRKNNIIGLLWGGTVAIICDLLFLMCIVYIISSEDRSEMLKYMIFLIAGTGYFGFILTRGAIETAKVVIDPSKSDVFKKYGDESVIMKIVDEIEKTVEYDDGKIVISQNYVFDKNDIEKLVACKDVLRVHKLEHKTNFFTDGYALVITDKYDCEIKYFYNSQDEETVDKLIAMLSEKCTNAMFGYTAQSEKYVMDNKIKLPK